MRTRAAPAKAKGRLRYVALVVWAPGREPAGGLWFLGWTGTLWAQSPVQGPRLDELGLLCRSGSALSIFVGSEQ